MKLSKNSVISKLETNKKHSNFPLIFERKSKNDDANDSSIINSRSHSSKIGTTVNTFQPLYISKILEKNENASVYKIKKPDNSDFIDVSSIVHLSKDHHISIQNYHEHHQNYQNANFSVKNNKHIRAYAYNSVKGMKLHNEDRIVISFPFEKPKNYEGYWPTCSNLFSIIDGHGGQGCAEFISNNVLNTLSKSKHWPNNPKEALISTISLLEKYYFNKVCVDKFHNLIDSSGACFIIILQIDDLLYIANLGDCRIIASLQYGKKTETLTKDHKPTEETEKQRILDNGGTIFQPKTPTKNFNIPGFQENSYFIGPVRVFPGKLTVTRSFGDIKSKKKIYGGLPNVIIATPDILTMRIKEDMDFLVIGSNGIYDALTNEEIVKCVWMKLKDKKEESIHAQAGASVDMIMKSALSRKSFDDMSCIILVFHNFEKSYVHYSFTTTDNSLVDQHLLNSLISKIPKTIRSGSQLILNEKKENNKFVTNPNSPIKTLTKSEIRVLDLKISKKNNRKFLG